MTEVKRDWFDQYMMPNYAPAAFIPVKGQSSKVWDQEGREYLDFSSGIAVTSLGHCNPEINEVLKKQSDELWHLSNIYAFEPSLKAAKALVEASGLDKVFFCNSGAEANEAAFKLARRYCFNKFGQEKCQIISFKQSFHGRSFFTVSVGGQEKYSDGFGPKPGAVTHVNFNDLEQLKDVVNEKTCAIVLELIQGEGGVVPATQEFVDGVKSLCEKFQCLMVVDEVQTGIGRTGKLFAYEHFGIKPDIVSLAKALGNGFPVGAVLATDEVSAAFEFGTHGSTYGGNPIAGAVVEKVLDIMQREGFLESVNKKSQKIINSLNAVNEKTQLFKEVRGKGLLIGAELNDSYKGKAKDFLQAMREEGVLALVAGPDVLRFAPALNISEIDLSTGLCNIEKAIQSVLSK